MPVTPEFRLVRAGVFASVCLGVSTTAHRLASQHDLPPVAQLTGFALVFAFAWATAGRERGFGTILGSMLWAQLALHLLFSLLMSAGASHAVVSHAADAGRTAIETVSPSGGSGPGMLLAHLAAALVCAWWLRRGEAAAFALVGLVASLVLPVLLVLYRGSGHPVRPPLRRRPGRGPRNRASSFLRHILVLRGPPLPHTA
ncbi:hypothetical protein ACFOVU_25900 [Nocardiopsis sediminis]|uniref:MFS transporter n=1 Tax=Nocardiopsis sediminis TaxID=1778267 RepID=A0ABV8FWW6_9ACTN